MDWNNKRGTILVYICERSELMLTKVRRILLLTALIFAAAQSFGTHLVGGFLSYRFLGSSGTSSSYRVTLYVYRDCINDRTPNEVPFDDEITLCIYNSNRSYFSNRNMPLVQRRKVDPVGNTTCPEVASACLEQGVYEATISLPNNSTGYHLKWERCCRNTQNNLRDDNTGTPYQGQTYYGFIPASALRNSSPVFQDVPVPFICARDTTTIRSRAIDPDGDSLSYRFVTPWQGATSSDPIFNVCPGVMTPFDDVEYMPGFNATRPFGAGGVSQIDPFNGLTTYMAPASGRYAVAIEVSEWRRGVKISEIRLDLQILVINCRPNNKPRLSYQGGTTTWFVEEGEQICRDVTVTDLDANDVVTLRSYGDIFTGANGYTGTRATMNPAAASGRRTATGRFCWQTDCGAARALPYRVTFEAYDNGCPSKFINENVLIFVRPFNPPETPTGPRNVCQNSRGVRYTLNNVTNPATGITYRWRVIGGTIDGDSTQNSVLVNWGNGTTGIVQLRITSRFGCTAGPRELTVNLIPAPAKPNITGNDTVCLNASSVFNQTSDPGVTYAWTASGGNILGPANAAALTVRWNVPGNGFVTLAVTNNLGCVSPIDTHRVFVSHPLTPPITGPISVCPNNRNIEYHIENPTRGSVYRWVINGGIQSSGGMSDRILVNWGGLGTGFVKVVEVNKFGCVGDTVSLPVSKNHALAGQLPQGDTSLCEFTSGRAYSIRPVNGETYNWIVTGGTIIAGQGTFRITVDWGAAGVGSVGVQATAYDSVSGLPCLSPVRARVVNLRPYPAARPIAGIFELCQTRTPGIFSITGFTGSTYQWDIPGLSYTGQGTTTVTVDLDTFGSFSFRVREISPFGCVGPWNDTTLVLHPRPRTTPLTGPAIICYPNLNNHNYAVTGFPGSTYNWWINGGTFNPAPAPADNSVRVDWNGQQLAAIGVREISSFGCVGDSVTLDVFVDQPFIVSRLVTVDPPPADDRQVLVYYRLINAPRYNNTIIIQRRPRGSAGSFASIGTAAPADTLYRDVTALTDSTSYEYRAVAVNLCGDSIYSNANTDILLKGRKTGPFTMTLDFTDYVGWANGVARYELYRLLENRQGYTLYKTYSAPQSDNFDNGKDHYGQYFRIRAVENGGLGRESWSNDIRIFYEPVVYIPNAFSPDENGLNDNFLPSTGGLKTYKFTIYSRWGEKLFTTTNPEMGWDGRYLGKLVQSGVYVYYCEYTDFRDKVYTTKGTLHLMR